MEDYSDLFKVQSVSEILNQVKTADVIDAETKANKYEDEMNAIEADIAKIDKDIDKELTGSGATGSRARLEKASRREALTDELIRVNKLYTTQANRANQIMTQNASALQTQMTQEQNRNSAIAWVMKSQFENEMNFQNKVREQEYANQVAREAMNDPYKAIPQMIDEYKKLGIPFTRSTQQIIQDFENSGKELSTYLSDLQKTIQGKPEYQKIQELQRGQLSDAQKMQMQQSFQVQSDVRNFNQQKELARLSKDLAREQFLFELENDPEKKAKVLELEQKFAQDKSLFDVLGVNVGTYEGNRGYDLAGKIGDPLPAGGNWKVISTDTAWEQVGSIFIGGKSKKPYGNTVVMEDENGNRIRYSHLDSIGVKPWDQLGFGDFVGTRGNTGNVLWKNGEKLTAEQLKAGRGAHLDIEIKDSTGRLLSQKEQVEWLKSKKAWGDLAQYSDSNIELLAELANMDSSARNTALKAQWIPLKAVTDYMALSKAGKIPPTQKQVQDSLNIMSQIQNIAQMDWNDATGMWRPQFEWGDRDTIRWKIDSLVANITLPNLGMLKWPMSDKDLWFIQNASTRLSYTQNDKAFEKEMVEMYNIWARKAWVPEIKRLRDIPTDRIMPWRQPQNSNTNIWVTNQIQYVSPTGKTYWF